MNSEKPRCLILFEQSCKSKATWTHYKGFLDLFLKWAHKDHQSLLLLSKKELDDLLQDYVFYLKKRCDSKEFHPNSFSTVFNGIAKFLDINDKEYNKRKLNMLFPQRVKYGGEKAITTKQIQQVLESTGRKREKALVHVFCSTGARPDAIRNLQLKNVVPFKDGYWKVILYPGDLHEMITFLHPEAVQSLEDYFDERKSNGEKLTSESYVFRSSRFIVTELKPHPLSLNALEALMNRLLQKSKIDRIKTGKRFDLATCTAMRKRFNTILERNSEISVPISQLLMDHTGYMDRHYLKPTEEELFEEYTKAVPDLVIDNSIRLREENRIKEQKISELESDKDRRISDLESKMDQITSLLEQAKNSS